MNVIAQLEFKHAYDSTVHRFNHNTPWGHPPKLERMPKSNKMKNICHSPCITSICWTRFMRESASRPVGVSVLTPWPWASYSLMRSFWSVKKLTPCPLYISWKKASLIESKIKAILFILQEIKLQHPKRRFQLSPDLSKWFHRSHNKRIHKQYWNHIKILYILLGD